LIRRPRALELTPAGLALLDYCGEMGAADQRLQQRLSAADAEQGEVSIISPGSIGLALYPRLLALQQQYPELSIRHRIAPAQEVLEAVLSNSAELGLVTLQPYDPRLTVRLFAQEPLELLAPAGEAVSNWEDLQRLGFIDHPDGQAMSGRLLSRRFSGCAGVRSLPCHGFTNQIGLILEPVARGLGFTVLPRYARQAFSRPELLQVVTGAPEVLDNLWLLHRAEWPLSSRAQRVLDCLQADFLPE
jgi:DNA-binding transcriptional LysR family regulator